jgi:hypothetical protein
VEIRQRKTALIRLHRDRQGLQKRRFRVTLDIRFNLLEILKGTRCPSHSKTQDMRHKTFNSGRVTGSIIVLLNAQLCDFQVSLSSPVRGINTSRVVTYYHVTKVVSSGHVYIARRQVFHIFILGHRFHPYVAMKAV